MKNKTLLILTLIFFVIVNTTYYWEGVLGIWAMPITLVLFLFFVILGIALIYHIVKSISEKFKSKNRTILLIVISLVIGLTIYKPFGLINFDKIEGKDLIVAQREGAANCMTTLKLKQNGNFVERSVCFGVDKTNGTYKLKNDTIWFSNISRGNEFYKYGVIIELENEREEIVLYHHENDTIPLILFVNKNYTKQITVVKINKQQLYSYA